MFDGKTPHFPQLNTIFSRTDLQFPPKTYLIFPILCWLNLNFSWLSSSSLGFISTIPSRINLWHGRVLTFHELMIALLNSHGVSSYCCLIIVINQFILQTKYTKHRTDAWQTLIRVDGYTYCFLAISLLYHYYTIPMPLLYKCFFCWIRIISSQSVP